MRVAVPDAARPYVAAALYHGLRLPVLVVTARPESARKLHEQLATWAARKLKNELSAETD